MSVWPGRTVQNVQNRCVGVCLSHRRGEGDHKHKPTLGTPDQSKSSKHDGYLQYRSIHHAHCALFAVLDKTHYTARLQSDLAMHALSFLHPHCHPIVPNFCFWSFECIFVSSEIIPLTIIVHRVSETLMMNHNLTYQHPFPLND